MVLYRHKERERQTKNLSNINKGGSQKQPSAKSTKKGIKMKKSNVTVDVMNKTISVTKSFYTRASVYGSSEYNELRIAVKENPEFVITLKEIEKKTYGKLTIERMKEYINTQPNSESNLKELEEVTKIAKAKGSKYPLTKKWFLAKFPEYKENEVKISSKEPKEEETSGKNVVEANISKDAA